MPATRNIDLGNTNSTGQRFKTGSGIVTIQIAGSVPKTGYGQISLGGGVKVILGNSVLRVVLLQNFVPAPGMCFETIVVRGTIADDFRRKELPPVPGISWQTSIVLDAVWQKHVLRAV